jgi:hypothetical protein
MSGVPTIKVYPGGSRGNEESASLQAVTDSIFEDMKAQVAELLVEADGTVNPKEEFQQKYIVAKNALMDYVAKKMAREMSGEMLNRVFNGASGIFESETPLVNAKAAGRALGTFIESEVFGLPENKLPLPDLEEINTELKGSLSSKEIHVGGTTLYNITESDALSQEKMNLMLLQKMAVKMSNFILFKLRYDTTHDIHRVNLHFGQITLFTVLFLKRLWDEINKTVEAEKVVKITPKGTWNRQDMSRSYDVEIMLNQTDGIYDFAKLYLRNFDLKKEMKTDSRFRKMFWSNVNNGTIKAAPLPNGTRLEI